MSTICGPFLYVTNTLSIILHIGYLPFPSLSQENCDHSPYWKCSTTTLDHNSICNSDRLWSMTNVMVPDGLGKDLPWTSPPHDNSFWYQKRDIQKFLLMTHEIQYHRIFSSFIGKPTSRLDHSHGRYPTWFHILVAAVALVVIVATKYLWKRWQDLMRFALPSPGR